MEKLYCYVDETGQDTQGGFFIVVSIVLATERDGLALLLEQAERQSGKGPLKWMRAKAFPKRISGYLDLVFAGPNFKGKVFYGLFRFTRDYDHVLAESIAAAVSRYREVGGIADYRATVVIDGLKKTEQAKVRKLLKGNGMRFDKVRGVRDEGDALIRLADTVAGVVREAEEGKGGWPEVKRRLERAGIVTEV